MLTLDYKPAQILVLLNLLISVLRSLTIDVKYRIFTGAVFEAVTRREFLEGMRSMVRGMPQCSAAGYVSPPTRSGGWIV